MTWLVVAGLMIFVVTVVLSLGFARAAARGDEQMVMRNPARDAPQPAQPASEVQHRARG